MELIDVVIGLLSLLAQVISAIYNFGRNHADVGALLTIFVVALFLLWYNTPRRPRGK